MPKQINASIVINIIGIIATLCGIATSIVAFQNNAALSYLIIAILSLVVIGIIVFLLIDIRKEKERKKQFDLLEILRNDKENQKWNEIIRLAYPLSRPLWLAKKYKLRVQFGRLVEESCNHLHNQKNIRIGKEDKSIKSILSEVLIDDLGWTQYKIHSNFKETARSSIQSGIEKAKKYNDYPVVIQGYRHLSGISSECGEDKEPVNDHLKEIQKIMDSQGYKETVDEKKQESIYTAIEYTYARNKIRFIRNKGMDGKAKDELIEEIFKHIDNSEKGLKGHDEDRYAKIFLVKAEAFMLRNDISSLNKADEILKEGHAYCETRQREDNLVRIPMSRLKVRLKKLQLLEERNQLTQNIKNSLLKEASKLAIDVGNRIIDADDYDEYKHQLNDLMRKINRFKK